MANPLLKINQPADVKLGQKGSLNLGILLESRPRRAVHRSL